MYKFEVGKEDLETYVGAASTFCREGNLQVEDGKLRFVGVDNAGVVLTEVEVPAKIIEGGPVVVSVPFDRLLTVAKKSKDVVVFEYGDGLVRVQAGKVKYTIQTLVGVKLQTVPTVPGEVTLKMDPVDVADGFAAVCDVADKKDLSAGVWMIWKDGQLLFRDKEQLAVEVEYAKEDYEVVQVKDGVSECRVLMSKLYVEGIADVVKKLDVCVMTIGSDMPLVLLAKNDRCKVGFVVAPRVEVS